MQNRFMWTPSPILFLKLSPQLLHCIMLVYYLSFGEKNEMGVRERVWYDVRMGCSAKRPSDAEME